MVSITVSRVSLAWKVFSTMVRQCQATVLTVRDIALFPTLTLLARLAPMVSVLSTSTVILFNARMS